jgi:hypothetical protein
LADVDQVADKIFNNYLFDSHFVSIKFNVNLSPIDLAVL